MSVFVSSCCQESDILGTPGSVLSRRIPIPDFLNPVTLPLTRALANPLGELELWHCAQVHSTASGVRLGSSLACWPSHRQDEDTLPLLIPRD